MGVMSVKVTLELADDLAERTRAAAAEMHLSFEDALVHWLGQAGRPAETSQVLPKRENAPPKGTCRRTLALFVLAPCLMLLLAAIVVWGLPRPGISEANYKRVKLGMSASEVGDILGPRYLKGWDRVEREGDISEFWVTVHDVGKVFQRFSVKRGDVSSFSRSSAQITRCKSPTCIG